MTAHHSHHWYRGALVAMAITGLAALAAWVLASVLHLSEPVVVITVMTVAFIASWAVTNHRVAHHRVTFVPLHARPR
jgi:hypothetical protein